MSNISKRKKEGSKAKIKSMGDHDEFLRRITKTLYYGQLPALPCLSLPVTELSCSLWSGPQRGRSLRRLHADAAAGIARSACVSPCALVLAVLYLERLNACNPDYLAATPPADLFLISLMVGNKFLQDDGEDDEVICSEWAASGDMDLKQLKKLEVEFLSAIDWNIFVSEKSFEAGLSWLERQVALRQARLRGFFTYADLAAGCGPAAEPLAELARAAAAAWLALTAAYLSSLLTLLASALVVSHAWLPALQYMAARNLPPAALDTNIIAQDLQSDLLYIGNTTLDLPPDVEVVIEDDATPEKLKCCTEWMRYHDSTEPRKNWFDGVVVYDWKSLEPWWSTTSVLNWLYQTSLVNPMQRWLEKMDEYADFVSRNVIRFVGTDRLDRCYDYVKHEARPRCVRQWLNLSKLSALIASVSDR